VAPSSAERAIVPLWPSKASPRPAQMTVFFAAVVSLKSTSIAPTASLASGVAPSDTAVQVTAALGVARLPERLVVFQMPPPETAR
jgi:hypothetical protein